MDKKDVEILKLKRDLKSALSWVKSDQKFIKFLGYINTPDGYRK